MSWWVADLAQSGQWTQLLSWIFWVVFSITLHELGHGWAALWQGDGTPRETGHMTWNPWVHMGPISLVMFAIIGICWGLMPVDPSRFRDGRRGRAWVAAAGPAINIGLAAVSILGLTVVGVLMANGAAAGAAEPPLLLRNLSTFFFVGSFLNIALALFNLLPVPPLDGSQIAAGLNWKAWELLQHPNASIVGLVTVLVLMYLGAFGFLFGFAADVTLGTSQFLVDLVT